MSKFSKFLKANKAQVQETQYAPTASLKDDDGTPLKWTFRPITSKENDKLRDECTREIPIPGKPHMTRAKTDISKYTAKMICASTVVPDLYDKELQDSYGVMSPEDLLYCLVDAPGEYQDLSTFVQKLSGFNVQMEELVEEAKN